MLPPAQLRPSLHLIRSQQVISHALRASAITALRGSLATNQPRRSFWGWRRNLDYTSHLDPLYQRFCRVRTLKTRAKLLRKLQRRGKFEWEGNGADFFTPKHIRWATRWDGPGGRRPWWIYPSQDGSSIKDEHGRVLGKEGRGEKDGEDGGFELSQREKIWKEQMERMRKRIESDPYEAIFGKRFEPFWSPLVPSWMREEMGLPVWKAKSSSEAAEKTSKAEVKSKETEVKQAEKTAKTDSTRTPEPPKKTEQKPIAVPKVEPDVPKATSYSYASSTTWDSWSNKTRRVEWDSASGQTKKYEYDPISNRMIQVEAPKPAEAKAVEAAPAATKTVEPNKSDGQAISIPVKQSSELRKSIPIPPPLSQPSHSIPIGFSTTTTTTSVGPLKSTAIASDSPNSTAVAADVPKPSAVATIPEPEKAKHTAKSKDASLESLTAEDVRANMGKPRTSSVEQPAFDQTKSSVKTQVDALLSERYISNSLPIRSRHNSGAASRPSEWDLAELNVLYDKELESLYKKKEKLLKDERGLFHIERQKRELMKLESRIKELIGRVERLNENVCTPSSIPAPEKASVGLQSSLDRMQSKSTPRAIAENQDPDDSAAHESTEPADSIVKSNVPRDWANQADLLQAARVRRSGIARGLYPNASKSMPAQPVAASITPAEISARKKANEARRAADEAKAAEEIAKIKAEKARLEREQKLEKANAMLADEVKEQKFRMQAHENRYAHKIRALRGELEIAYKQSAVHGEKHVERIRNLEAELEKAQKAIGEKGKAGVEASQAEGDLASGVTNWYQQASAKMEEGKKSKGMKEAEQRRKDRELVKEIKSIYEKRYGIINAEHRQAQLADKVVTKPQVVEVESDVDLGEALAKYEKEHSFNGLPRGLERALQAEEREANEGIKLVDDNMPRLIPTEMWKADLTAAAGLNDVMWEIPPVYKVLAYDSGNDMMSTATTTSNFTGSETPISIPEALNQLYAPARFVGAFADLQKEGYQVIYGARDLLVFRKVADPTALPAVEKVTPALEDHGLVAGENHPDHWDVKPAVPKATDAATSSSTGVNPVDGTSAPPVERLEQILKSGKASSVLSDEHQNIFDTETTIRHYPRVKRDEYPVFTGTKRKWRSHVRHTKKEEWGSYRERRRKERKFWRRAIGVGLVGAGVAYFIGAAAEKSRGEPVGGAGKGREWERKVERTQQIEKEKEKEGKGWMWK